MGSGQTLASPSRDRTQASRRLPSGLLIERIIASLANCYQLAFPGHSGPDGRLNYLHSWLSPPYHTTFDISLTRRRWARGQGRSTWLDSAPRPWADMATAGEDIGEYRSPFFVFRPSHSLLEAGRSIADSMGSTGDTSGHLISRFSYSAYCYSHTVYTLACTPIQRSFYSFYS